MSAELKALIIRQARVEGFADARVTVPNAVPQAAGRLAEYLAHGRHGQMQWMAERTRWRGNPAALWPEARSVLMLAETYTPETDPLAILEQPEKGAISVYAQGRDYHDVVKKRLKSLGRWMIETVRKGGYRDADTGKWVKLPVAAQVETPEIKVFVDTAPVMEKPLAASAGLGWQGKHTNLLSRELGNWFFLGAIFTTLDLPPDPPAEEHCGTCTACLDICPTGAFPAPFQLDARRCISYLTIEHAGPVDLELRAKMGNRIYGCDDCLAICPWNKFARAGRDARLDAREDLLAPDLSALSRLDDTAFRDLFSGSPVKRIGRDRFVRNVLYAIGNSGLPALLPDAEALTGDPDETVRDAARWAVERLRRI